MEKKALLKTALFGARNVAAVALMALIASTSAVGALWATGELDLVVTEACQAVGAPPQQAQAASPQVLLVPVAYNIPMLHSPLSSPMARWASSSVFNRDAVVVTTNAKKE